MVETLFGGDNLSFKYFLPSEIWEKIIEFLANEPYSLVRASRVCRQWRHLVVRLCQRYCNIINQRLLAELRETAVTHRKCNGTLTEENVSDDVNGEWIDIYELYQQTKLSCERKVEEFIYVGEIKYILSATTAGPYLILTTFDEDNPVENSKLHIFNSALPVQDLSANEDRLQMGQLRPWKTIDVHEAVFNTWLLTLPTPIILMHTRHQDLKTLSFEDYHRHPSHNKQFPFTNCRIKTNYKLCTEGSLILTQTEEKDDFLTLYEAFLTKDETHEEVEISKLLYLHPEARLHCWNLCRGLVTTIETSGHARVYKINDLDAAFQMNFPQQGMDEGELLEEPKERNLTTLVAETDFRNDLRYLNPVLLSQNFIFSSTYNSKILLLYWHMDRDLDYWLCGTITKSLLQNKTVYESSVIPSYLNLHKLNLGPSSAAGVVTTVHFQRGVLFCGTKQGQILAYKTNENLDEDTLFQSLCDPPFIDVPKVISGPVILLASAFIPTGILLTAVGRQKGSGAIIFFPSSGPENTHVYIARNLTLPN